MIAYEDFRFRAVHWYWLVILFLGVIYFFPFQLFHSLANLCLCGIQFLFLKLYFSIKENKKTVIIDKYIGWGDILMILILCLLFNFYNMVFFIVISFSLTLLVFYVVSSFSKKQETIPLAGALSIFIGIALILDKLKIIDFFRGNLLIDLPKLLLK